MFIWVYTSMCMCMYFCIYMMTLAEVKIKNKRAHIHTQAHITYFLILGCQCIFLNSYVYQLFVFSSCKSFAILIFKCCGIKIKQYSITSNYSIIHHWTYFIVLIFLKKKTQCPFLDRLNAVGPSKMNECE